MILNIVLDSTAMDISVFIDHEENLRRIPIGVRAKN